MEMNTYQKEAKATAIYPNDGNITYLALALCGEAGEVADKIKKVLRDKQGQFYAPDIAALEADITKKRQEWHDENAKQYNGDDVCYHCGQPLPPEMRERNLADFNKTKNDNKAKIQAQGKEMAQRLEALKKALQDTDNEIAEQEDDVKFVRSLQTADTSIYITDLAKLIAQNGVDIGGIRLFKWMRDNGFLTLDNKPTQRAVDLGVFEIKTSQWENPKTGEMARMLFVYHCRQLKMTLTQIAKHVHRDHSSMLHFLRKYDDDFKYNPQFREMATKVNELINCKS